MNVANIFTAAENTFLNITADSGTFGGPTPHVDIAAYGARPENDQDWTSGTISASSHSLTIANNPGGGTGFQNGDGLSVYGAGATNTLTTPSAPTVTVSNAAFATGTGIDVPAPAGSTTYSYKCVALGAYSSTPSANLWGAYTASSPATTVTTANPTGSQTVVAQTESEQNGVLTIVTATAPSIGVGAYFSIAGTSDDYDLAGQYLVTSVSGSTITANTGKNTPSAVTGTGGTFGWFNANHINCGSLQSGQFNFAVYTEYMGTYYILGFSWPGQSWVDDIGAITNVYYQDYGYTPVYEWLCSGGSCEAPSTAQNGVLTTTITAGGGTTSLTLAAAATNGVSGAFTVFDDAPTILAAAQAAVSGGGPLYINCSGSFPITSYLDLAQVGGNLHVQQCGILSLQDPMEWGTFTTWLGNFTGQTGIGSPGWGNTVGAQISVGTAFPGIYSAEGNGIFVDHTQIFQNQAIATNNALLTAIYNAVPGPTWINSSWSTGGSQDFNGIHLLLGPDNDTSGVTLTNDSFNAGPNEAANLTTTPSVILQAVQQLTLSKIFVNRRGFAEADTPGSGYYGMSFDLLDGAWNQGLITPFLMSNAQFSGGVTLPNVVQDTSGQPIFANLFDASDAGGGVLTGTVQISNPSIDLPYDAVTGAAITDLQVNQISSPVQVGQSTYTSLGPGGISAPTVLANILGSPNAPVTAYINQFLFDGPNPAIYATGKNTPPTLPSGTVGGIFPGDANGYVDLYNPGSSAWEPGLTRQGTYTPAHILVAGANQQGVDSGVTIAGLMSGFGVYQDATTPVTVASTPTSAFHNNQNTTASAAVTYDLPTAAQGLQFCFVNSNNGSAANTGALTLQTSASGQYIIFTDGTLSASNGYVESGGAANDSACVVGVDTTHWQLYVQNGTWTKH